jgi:drug/metabolite transporter (DMT)-like permease
MSLTRRAYFAWIAVCLIWGTTYLGIRIALETIPPFLMGAWRWIIAGALMIVVLVARGERLPPMRLWGSLAVLGLLLIGFGNGGVVWAERTVPSGLTAVLVAMSPFWMVGIDAFMPDGDPLTLRRIAGLVVGFVGILVLVWPELGVSGATNFLTGVIAAQIACFGWAVGSIFERRHGREENVLGTAAFEMLFGGLVMLAIALVRHEPSMVTFTPRTAAALAYLTLVGAIGGFSAYTFALKHLPLATVSLYAYVNPVIAVLLGTLILSEPLDARPGIAAGIVLAGMALVRPDARPAGATAIRPVGR